MERFFEVVLPSAGALFFFVIGLRALFQADRRERAAMARFEHEQAVRAGATSVPARTVPTGSSSVTRSTQDAAPDPDARSDQP